MNKNSNNNPLVTVIISAYNHEKYIGHTINSILNQTLKDFKIIIIDDFSQDDTYNVALSFSKNNNKITVYRNKENLGPSANLNKAISISNSKYISLIASDDIMKEDKLEKQCSFLDINMNYSAVFSKIETIDENNNSIRHPSEKLFNKKYESSNKILNYFFYNGNFINACTVTIRRSSLESVLPYKNTSLQLQDFDIWIRLLLKRKEIFCLEEKLVQYRICNNLSEIGVENGSFEMRSRMIFEYRDVLRNYLKINNLEYFKSIFPDFRYANEHIDKRLIKFYIAIESYKVFKQNNFIPYYIFAYETLTEIMNDDKLRLLANKKHNFKMSDFFKIANNNPVLKNNISNQSLEIKATTKKKSFIKKFKKSILKRLSKAKCIKL